MRVSVIVPTYKRGESLSRCLDALARQDRKPDEVLVAVRDTDRHSQEIVRQRSSSVRLVLVGRPGMVAAINAGIDASVGDVICLTDDDAQPRRDWISQILATFAIDPSIGAVGGRDWVYAGDRLEDGAKATVGRISWFGRMTGNHHLGIGPARDVDVLKGVNLSVRGTLMRAVRIDERLLGEGTERHSEVGLCLALRDMGYRIVYDPAIAVEHHPQPRVDDSREFGRSQVRDAAHNETLAVLEHLSPMRRTAFLLWSTIVGTHEEPGLAQAARQLIRTGDPELQLLLGNLTGRSLAISTYLHSSQFKLHSGRRARRPRSLGSASTTTQPQPTAAARRPRVALVAHDVHDQGGMERVCAELIRRGSGEFDFVVVSATLARDLRPLVADWIRIRAPARPFPFKFASFWLLAGPRVRSLDVDIVHTVGAIVPNRADVIAVHFCHAGFAASQGPRVSSGTPRLRRFNTSVARRLALAAERWSYRPSRVRAFAAVSAGVREELLRYYGGVDVHVTPNGVDLDRFRPRPSAREQLRAEQHVQDATVALFVGGDWDRKGLGLALEALARLKAGGSKIRLWVVGRGDRARFEELARTLQVSSDLQFFGQRADTERFYSAADVFVLPTSYEAFSLVTLEAAASGLPVIMPAINGASELVGDDEAGLLVERTVDSVVAALARIVDDADLRSRLGREARRRATRYAWDDTTRAVTELYALLLGSEPALADVDNGR